MVFVREKPNWGKGEEFLGPRHLSRLKKIVSFIPKKKCLFLDAAVGLGVLSNDLLKKGYFPIGVDLDFGAAMFSQKKGIRTLVASLEKLPFKTSVFPLIISSETLEHLDDYKIALYEFERILKNEGNLIISVPLNEWLWSYWDEWAGHKRRFSPKTLVEDFKPFKIQKAIFFGFPFMLLYDLIFMRNFIKKRGEGKINTKKRSFYIFLRNLLKFPLTSLFSIYIPFKKFSPNLILKLEKK